jgi:outer membrane biosynthesis protein TonB
MTNKQLTILRAAASAAITLLAVLYSLYPSYTWITAVIAAAATLGIHAIPAIGQSTGGNTMSEQPEAMPTVEAPPLTPPVSGSVLMGVQPAYPVQDDAPVQPVEQPVEQPETPEAPTAVVEQPPTVTAAMPVLETQQRTAPVDSPTMTVAQRLRALADELENL